jgi:CO/xanthine dehydrogenase Mo-binding subunit
LPRRVTGSTKSSTRNSRSTKTGRILALAAEVIGDIGAYSIFPWTAALEPVQVVSFMPGPYRVPTYQGHARAVATCKAPTGPYRGVGLPISTFVMERLIDMAARHLTIDPVIVYLVISADLFVILFDHLTRKITDSLAI